jgi:hypothetical protein
MENNMNNKKLPDWLVLEIRRCLNSEIYPAIRVIAVSFNAELGHLLMRYYLDREPRDADYESLEIVACQFFAANGDILIKKFDIDCQYSTAFFKDIDGLDGFIYSRRENDLEDVM